MSNPVCPYCRTPITSDAEMHACGTCGTPHHAECWEENGGCTVFGCAEAPVEEAKVVVSGAELSGAPGYGGGPYGTTGVGPPPPNGVMHNGFEADSVTASHPTGTMFGLSELYPQPIPLTAIEVAPSTNRTTYVVLGVLFGFLGVHNLYANRTSIGIMQLCITVLTCFLAAPVTWIWALIEIARMEEDGDGNRMI